MQGHDVAHRSSGSLSVSTLAVMIVAREVHRPRRFIGSFTVCPLRVLGLLMARSRERTGLNGLQRRLAGEPRAGVRSGTAPGGSRRKPAGPDENVRRRGLAGRSRGARGLTSRRSIVADQDVPENGADEFARATKTRGQSPHAGLVGSPGGLGDICKEDLTEAGPPGPQATQSPELSFGLAQEVWVHRSEVPKPFLLLKR